MLEGFLTSDCFSRLKTVYSARNGAPTKAEEPFLCQFVFKRREMAQLVPTRAFLHPANAAAMCTVPHAKTRPTFPYPSFIC